CHRGNAIAARYIVEQPLEFVNIVLDRLTKIRIGPVFTAYLLKCALPLGSIKTLGEDTALAALIVIPQICGGIIVDHPGDIDREYVDRIDALARRSLLAPPLFGCMALR